MVVLGMMNCFSLKSNSFLLKTVRYQTYLKQVVRKHVKRLSLPGTGHPV
jgi:hypothetical protein